MQQDARFAKAPKLYLMPVSEALFNKKAPILKPGLLHLVELGGVEPPSESTLPLVLHA